MLLVWDSQYCAILVVRAASIYVIQYIYAEHRWHHIAAVCNNCRPIRCPILSIIVIRWYECAGESSGGEGQERADLRVEHTTLSPCSLPSPSPHMTCGPQPWWPWTRLSWPRARPGWPCQGLHGDITGNSILQTTISWCTNPKQKMAILINNTSSTFNKHYPNFRLGILNSSWHLMSSLFTIYWWYHFNGWQTFSI